MPWHAMPYHGVWWSCPDDEPQGARSQGPAKDQAEKRETRKTETRMLRAPRPRIVDPVRLKWLRPILNKFNSVRKMIREDHFCNPWLLTIFDGHFLNFMFPSLKMADFLHAVFYSYMNSIPQDQYNYLMAMLHFWYFFRKVRKIMDFLKKSAILLRQEKIWKIRKNLPNLKTSGKMWKKLDTFRKGSTIWTVEVFTENLEN